MAIALYALPIENLIALGKPAPPKSDNTNLKTGASESTHVKNGNNKHTQQTQTKGVKSNSNTGNADKSNKDLGHENQGLHCENGLRHANHGNHYGCIKRGGDVSF
jgi:hypothetical protein